MLAEYIRELTGKFNKQKVKPFCLLATVEFLYNYLPIINSYLTPHYMLIITHLTFSFGWRLDFPNSKCLVCLLTGYASRRCC